MDCEKLLKELEEEVMSLDKTIDKLEFDSPITWKTFIFGNNKYDKELERLKVSRYTIKYIIKKLKGAE